MPDVKIKIMKIPEVTKLAVLDDVMNSEIKYPTEKKINAVRR